MKKFKNRPTWKKVKSFLMIEAGTFVFALAVGLFILPGKILSGGVAGITALLSAYVKIPEDILTILINLFLFLLGSVFLGKEFLFNTLIFSVSYPFFLLLVTRLLPSYEVDPLLAAIYGGTIGGIGVGLMFRNGGSSGGTDKGPGYYYADVTINGGDITAYATNNMGAGIGGGMYGDARPASSC